MSRSTLIVAFLVLTCIATVASAATEGESGRRVLFDPHSAFDYVPMTPGITGGAVAAMANPAAWVLGDSGEIALWWDDYNRESGQLDNYGFALGRYLGFSMDSRLLPGAGGLRRVTGYQVGLARGGRVSSWGLGYRWTNAGGGNPGDPRLENALVIGHIVRPAPWLCYGMSGQFSTRSSARLGAVDLGLRPLGTDLLTLCGDYSVASGESMSEGSWGAGFELRPIDGLHLGARLVDDQIGDQRFVFDIGVTVGGLGLHSLQSGTSDDGLDRTTWLLRTAPSCRGLSEGITGALPSLGPPRRQAVINLENRELSYQRYRWGNDPRVSWLDLYRSLAEIRDDDEIEGVLLNLSGFRARPSLAWELRSVLQDLSDAGKRITIQIDRAGMMGFYIASVADKLCMDPQGGLTLPGIALNRTYMKETLDKIGLGFQELRYFTHKTAVEVLSRTSMSEADRQQRGRIVDVIYETVRDGVTKGRGLNDAAFDAVVDEQVMLDAGRALDAGLVDEISRWESQLKACPGAVGMSAPGKWQPPQDEIWSVPPRIVVVYAIGGCSMDEGIKGRTTSAFMRSLVGDPTVAAVVLRADSPGGDPLPSDLVADAITQLRDAGKPVIISQGDVAASGGYWISMNGSHIMSTPVTVTGSIGVISGWLYDNGVGSKIGMSADGVQRGAHADLFAPMRLPLFGISVPTRPMNEDELKRSETYIRDMYSEFVSMVASGRGLAEERVREIAEGRVWMGTDALDLDLVDSIGTLPDAIEMAAAEAGLPGLRNVEVREYPPRPLFKVPNLSPGLPGIMARLNPFATADRDAETEEAEELGYDLRYLRSLAATAGAPMLMLPPDLVPAGWLDAQGR